jgi:hypothetical protein
LKLLIEKEARMFTPNGTFTLLAVLAAFILCTATASAQSGLQNSPQAFTFTFNNCNGQQQITGVTTSGASAVLLDSSSTAVYVATAVTVSETFSTGQPPVTFSLPIGAGHGQATGLHGSLITCTSEPITFPVPGGTGTAIETVTMFSTPL